MNFFVVAIGHSGSRWLAHVLGCAHEEADSRDKSIPHPWTPFPVERFWTAGNGYGEVNGMLRFHLSGQYPGRERLIPRRAWLRRNPRAVVTSWMNDELDRDPLELSAICWEVMWHYKNLSEWAAADSEARVIDLETLSTNIEALREFLSWLEVKRTITEDSLRPIGVTPKSRTRFTWGAKEEDVLRRTMQRLRFSGDSI